MNILVTGGSGFIGGAIAIHLAKNSAYHVTATGRSACPEHLKNVNLDYLQLDLCSIDTVLNYDVCIHCAGLADDQSSWNQLMQNNVVATENLLKSLTNCSTFVFISSASVYDFKKFPTATEDSADSSDKISTYGQTKFMAEALVKQSGIPSIYLLRPRAVYGEGDRVLYPRIMSRLKGRTFVVPGNLKVETSLTNIQNLVEAVYSCISEKKQGTSIFNVADSNTYDLRDVFKKLGEQKVEKVRFISLPVGFIRGIVRLCERLRIRIPFSQQSIDYVTLPSTLNTALIQESLQIELNHNLSDFLKKSSSINEK